MLDRFEYQKDKYDWNKVFSGATLRDGTKILVVQVGWDDFHVNAEPHKCIVHINPKAGPPTIEPDFVLVRNEVRTVSKDFRNLLYGLMFSGVQSVNSLSSIYSFCERPIIQAELNRLSRQLGREVFPVVDQSYFSGFSSMMYGNAFPAVCKVGHAHAGIGKMKIANHRDMEDFRSVLAMTGGQYCTAEPFIVGKLLLTVVALAVVTRQGS